MTTALVCIALLGLLLFGLGFSVSLARGRTDTLVGSSDDPVDPLHKLVRAHGNTAEYAAMLAILIFLVGTRSPATWALWCMGIATACRYSLALGLILSPSLDGPHPLRFVGALGTYLAGFGLCAALLLSL
jgi:uncharacterized membrane protein YecN with MAPEG domain